MHLAREEAAKAYPRLLRALDAWPDAGFLAVGVADCAVRVGDLEKAEQYLAVGERLGLRDPFSSHVRVRADLRAAQGRNAEAHADYEWMLVNHKAILARLHYARLLEREGDLERAKDLLFELFERQPDRIRYGARLWELAESWWTSLPMASQVTEVLASWNTLEPWPRLRRLATVREVLEQESQETSTAGSPSASLALRRRIGSKSTLPTELAVMTMRECELLRRVPSVVQRFAACILLIAENRGHSVWQRLPDAGVLARRATWASLLVTGWIAALLPTRLVGQVQWTNRTPTSGSPVARWHSGSCFDAITRETLVYGGGDGVATHFGDLWSWNGLQWLLLDANPGPGRRAHARLIQEGDSGGLLLFGGAATSAFGDTWRWNRATWSLLSPSPSPQPRYSYAWAYDANRRVVVLFGGLDSAVVSLSDTWEWSTAMSTWTRKSPPVFPPSRYAHGMCYDAIRQRVVLFGGATYPPNTLLNDTWEWDGIQWVDRMPSPRPAPRIHSGMVWDDARGCAVIYGGWNFDNSIRSDTWEWDGSSWTMRTPLGPLPPARAAHSLVYDAGRREAVAFGGSIPTARVDNDTWILEPKNGAHADYTSTGPGCPGAQGTPSLAAVPGSLPWIGRTFTAQVTSIPNGFPYISVVFLGFTNLGLPLCLFNRCGCVLRTDPAGPTFTLAPSNNQATWSIPIPNDCNLLGFSGLYTQVAVLNFVSGLDAMSNGMQMTIGAR